MTNKILLIVVLLFFNMKIKAQKNKEIKLPEIEWRGEIQEEKSDLGLYNIPNIETITLFKPNDKTGTFNHHPYITYFNSTLVASWSNHERDEDAPGQWVMWSYSSDGGENWSNPKQLFPSVDDVELLEDEEAGDRTMIANGFAHIDGDLFAIAEVWQWGTGRRDGLRGGIAGRDGIGRLARRVKLNGELGPIFWLEYNAPLSLPGYENYESARHPEFEKIALKINNYLANPMYWPQWELKHNTTKPKAADGHQLAEPTRAWQLKDGTYARFWRDLNDSYYNYVSYSFDYGSNWTDPIQTNFPDADSRSTSGKLSDGSIYIVSNIRRKEWNTSNYSSRDPLAISIANDGLKFNRVGIMRHNAPQIRYSGRSKGPGFQYPHSVTTNDALWVIYSVGKEDIQVSKIPMDDLYKIPKQEQALD